VLTQPLPSGGAVQLGRSLASVDASLGNLRIILALLVAAGTALAAALGRLFARRAISPITALTEAAEHVEATADLNRRIPAPGRDEVGRLGRGFNRMLDRLQAAQDAQRQLVADASHELRTPVTSLRTNAEVLRDTDGLDPATRRALAGDVVEQAEELTALMADLIELARGDVREPEREDVRLDALAAEAVQRARRHAPGLDFRLDAEPVVVDGAPGRLARAINNLLDNAAAHSPAGGAIDVRVTAGELLVRDHGPGIAPGDCAHVFDRFYRGSASRGLRGSGLGLAIVKQVAEAHDAVIALEPAPGGGTVARLRFSGARGSAPAPR
jgi:two-component system sensor histidine kinase MprB